ncbi:MAG: hypothetical protein ABEI86_13340 [Halobacteriaceae archaeon]
MVDGSRFGELFYNIFRFHDYEESSIRAIQLLRRQLHQGRWQANEVTDRFNTIQGTTSRTRRPDAERVLSDLNELVRDESNQKEAIESDLQDAIGDVSLEELHSKSHFLQEYVAQKNNKRRESIQDSLDAILEEAEQEIRDAGFEFSALRQRYESGSEEEVVSKLREFYNYLRSKGWHPRDLQDRITPLRMADDQLEFLQRLHKRDATSATFVFFLPTTEVESYFGNVGDIKEIVPPGTYDIDDLKEVYPYDDIPAPEFFPDESDYSPPSPDPDEDLSPKEREEYVEQVKERHEKKRVSYQLKNATAVVIEVEGYGTHGRTEEALDVLSQFFDSYSYSNSLSYAEDPHYTDRLHYLQWLPNGNSRSSLSSKTDQVSDVAIQERDIESVKHILNACKSSSGLADNLRRGLHLYRKANLMHRDEDRIIYYIASLETISSTDNTYREEVIDNIIVISGLYDISETRDRLEAAYRARNSSIHAGVQIDEADSLAEFLRLRVKRSLYRLAQCIQDTEATDISDFIDYASTLKQRRRKKLKLHLSRNGFNTGSVYKFDTKHETEYHTLDIRGCYIFIDSGTDIIPRLTISHMEAYDFGEHEIPPSGRYAISVKEGDSLLTFHDIHIPQKAGVASTSNFFRYISPINLTAPTIRVNE